MEIFPTNAIISHVHLFHPFPPRSRLCVRLWNISLHAMHLLWTVMTKVLMRGVILQAGHVVAVGEIIVRAPKEAKAYLEEKET